MAATFQQVWFICMFLSLNCLFITFDFFSVGHSVFYWFLERPFYIIETNPLFVNWTANIFSQYALWPLVLFKVFITMQKVDFYVVEFINLFFLLQLLAFVSCLEMFPLHWKKIFFNFHMFSSSMHMLSFFMFKFWVICISFWCNLQARYQTFPPFSRCQENSTLSPILLHAGYFQVQHGIISVQFSLVPILIGKFDHNFVC